MKLDLLRRLRRRPKPPETGQLFVKLKVDMPHQHVDKAALKRAFATPSVAERVPGLRGGLVTSGTVIFGPECVLPLAARDEVEEGQQLDSLTPGATTQGYFADLMKTPLPEMLKRGQDIDEIMRRDLERRYCHPSPPVVVPVRSTMDPILAEGYATAFRKVSELFSQVTVAWTPSTGMVSLVRLLNQAARKQRSAQTQAAIERTNDMRAWSGRRGRRKGNR